LAGDTFTAISDFGKEKTQTVNWLKNIRLISHYLSNSECDDFFNDNLS
jgi:hypothetical protein